MDAHRLQPDFVADACTASGLDVEARLVREPQPPHEKTPQAYLLARKPSRPSRSILTAAGRGIGSCQVT
jgi:hypothetical protein